MKKGKDNVLVIAHDAGAAEIIVAHLVHERDKLVIHAFIAGPAVLVFRREGIPYKKAPNGKAKIMELLRKHADVDLVLLGTGWMTSIESDALKAVKQLGMKHAVYLESWVNYRERFGYPERGWRKNLPDEIWVGDREAFSMAQKYFPKTRLRYIPNRYFMKMVARYKEEKAKLTSRPDAILFLSDSTPESDVALRKLLDFLLLSPKAKNLVVRLHPADPKDRYNELLARYKTKIRLKVSREKDIVRNLISARLVIGTETVALVVALLVGVKTVSLVSKGKRPQLPFPEIVRVQNIERISNLI